jgi:uncharacterized protein YjbJ (UPF0337 family)
MRNDVLKTHWKTIAHHVHATWTELTDDDLTRVQGHWDLLVDRIEERTGDLRTNIENRLEDLIDAWLSAPEDRFHLWRERSSGH